MSVVGDLTEPICLTNGWTQTFIARVSITIVYLVIAPYSYRPSIIC